MEDKKDKVFNPDIQETVIQNVVDIFNAKEFEEYRWVMNDLMAQGREPMRNLILQNLFAHVRGKYPHMEELMVSQPDFLRRIAVAIYAELQQSELSSDIIDKLKAGTVLTENEQKEINNKMGKLSRDKIAQAVVRFMDSGIVEKTERYKQLPVESDAEVIKRCLLADHPQFQNQQALFDLEAKTKKRIHEIMMALTDKREIEEQEKQRKESFLKLCVTANSVFSSQFREGWPEDSITKLGIVLSVDHDRGRMISAFIEKGRHYIDLCEKENIIQKENPEETNQTIQKESHSLESQIKQLRELQVRLQQLVANKTLKGKETIFSSILGEFNGLEGKSLDLQYPDAIDTLAKEIGNAIGKRQLELNSKKGEKETVQKQLEELENIQKEKRDLLSQLIAEQGKIALLMGEEGSLPKIPKANGTKANGTKAQGTKAKDTEAKGTEIKTEEVTEQQVQDLIDNIIQNDKILQAQREEGIPEEVRRKTYENIVEQSVKGWLQSLFHENLENINDNDIDGQKFSVEQKNILKSLVRYFQYKPEDRPDHKLLAELDGLMSEIEIGRMNKSHAQRVARIQEIYHELSRIKSNNPAVAEKFGDISDIQKDITNVAKENMGAFHKVSQGFWRLESVMKKIRDMHQWQEKGYSEEQLRQELWLAKKDLMDTIDTQYGPGAAQRIFTAISEARQQQINDVAKLAPGDDRLQSIFRTMPYLFQQAKGESLDQAAERLENVLLAQYPKANKKSKKAIKALARNMVQYHRAMDKCVFDPNIVNETTMHKLLELGSKMSNWKVPEGITKFAAGCVGFSAAVIEKALGFGSGLVAGIGKGLQKPADFLLKGKDKEGKPIEGMRKFLRYGLLTGGVLLALTNPITAGLLATGLAGTKVAGWGMEKGGGAVEKYEKDGGINTTIKNITEQISQHIDSLDPDRVNSLSKLVSRFLDGLCGIGLKPFKTVGWTFDKMHKNLSVQSQRKFLKTFYGYANTHGRFGELANTYNLGRMLQLQPPELYDELFIPGFSLSWNDLAVQEKDKMKQLEEEARHKVEEEKAKTEAEKKALAEKKAALMAKKDKEKDKESMESKTETIPTLPVTPVTPPTPEPPQEGQKSPQQPKQEKKEEGEGETKPKKVNKEESKTAEEPPKEATAT